MKYVKLNRSFAPITKNEEENLNIGSLFGHRFAGWFDWPQLIEHRRVALLAEASSGKTAEFRHQAETLASQRKAAFFVRIEELADNGFEAALDRPALQRFERWRTSTDELGWFFLDAVDEARLNNKSFETALKCFSRELDRSLERACIYLSCRVTDWKGQTDRDTIDRYLPEPEIPTAPIGENDEAELLDPIFRNGNESGTDFAVEFPERKSDSLLVVRLVPLSAEQKYEAARQGDRRKSDKSRLICREGVKGMYASCFTSRP